MALNDQQRKFVEGVVSTGMICRSAEAAGYSRYSGFAILKNPDVAAAIAECNIERKAHQEQTYRNMCQIAEEAMAVMWETLKSGAPLEEKQLAMEGAARQVERVARCEGMMLPGGAVDAVNRAASLQTIIQIVQRREQLRNEPLKQIDMVPPPANGNGKNGQNH